MNPERWQQVERLYFSALKQEPDQRATFLSDACQDDSELRREVEALLAQASEAPNDASPWQDTATILPAGSRGMVAPGTQLRAGQHLGPYRIEAILGVGGMGQVYRAVDTRLGRKVAIKVSAEQFSGRFEREARAISALNHPHICTLYDVGALPGGSSYLVTELVEGETLRDWLNRVPTAERSIDTVGEVARQVLEALRAAHQAGIIHRDLKPANIMIRFDGYVKVLDFGLAKRILSAGVVEISGADLSLPGQILGTVAYMSPEQIQGQETDPRSDLFAFGIILYEMLAGRHPWPRKSAVDTMHAILHDAPPSMDAASPFAAELTAILQKLLCKNPAERYPLAEAVLEALATPHPTRAWKSVTAVAPASVGSIAVLPFTDMSAAKDQDWFCDGIAEEILNALTPLKGLRVAARTSAFSFKGKSDDLRTIGEKLNVTTVLEGSVRRAGDRVRITAQLSNVQNGYQLWSERYDRELKDIFDVQDEIAKAIAARLSVTLAGLKDDRLVEQATPNVEAYQLYLKGRALLSRRGVSIPPALDLFRKAVELDPHYALAWAGVADAFIGLAIAGSVRGSESRTQALEAATRSVELDPGSAAGHSALACATLLYQNNRTLAGQEFERALELSPSYALGRSWYAVFYLQWARGEFERGITEARRALDIDPLSSYLTMIFACGLYTAGRLDEAIEAARRAVQQDPESFVARWALGVSLRMAGRFEEAVSTLEAAAAISGRHPRALSSLAGVFGQWGKFSDASVLHRELMDRTSRGYVPSTYLILTADAAGQREEALAFAQRAWDEREVPFILHARHLPEFHVLRSDPRFAAIVREMDSP